MNVKHTLWQFVVWSLLFCNAGWAGSGKATIAYVVPGYLKDNYGDVIEKSKIVELDLKTRQPARVIEIPIIPGKFNPYKNGPSSRDGNVPRALAYDAAGNLYFEEIYAAGDAHSPYPFILNLRMVAAGATEPTDLTNIITVTQGQSFSPYSETLAYDATRNVIAYMVPGLSDGYGTMLKSGKLVEFDLKTKQPLRTIDMPFSFALQTALTYDAAGNLYFEEVTFDGAYTVKLKKLAVGTTQPVDITTIMADTYPQGGSPMQTLAYDATRDVIAYGVHVVADGRSGKRLQNAKIVEFDLKTKQTVRTIDIPLTSPFGIEARALTYDAAGNLFFRELDIYWPERSKLKMLPVGATQSTDITPLPMRSNDWLSWYMEDLAYDPGQRIFLDWNTQLPVQVCEGLDLASGVQIYSITNCSPDRGGCPAKPGKSVTVVENGANVTKNIPPCPAGPDNVMSLSPANRDLARQNVAKLYAQSGAALPVLTSDTFPDLTKGKFGSPYGKLAIDDAVRVRNSVRRQGLFGYAYEGIDQCNAKSRSDNIALFGSVLNNPPPLSGMDEMSITIAHEVGHALGLRHVLAGTGNPQGWDIMDYIDQLLFDDVFGGEVFDSFPLSITEPPKIGGDVSDKNGPYGTHSPLFHLLAYSLDFDPTTLAKQYAPGSWDLPENCANQANSNAHKIWAWSDLSLVPNVAVSDFVLLEINGSSPGGFEGSPEQPLDSAKRFDKNRYFHMTTDRPVKLLASTKGGGVYDVVFGIGDPNNPKTEFTADDSNISGSIFQYDGSGAAPKVIGSFSASIQPVTQADLSVELAGTTLQAKPNDRFTLTATVQNIGAAIAHGSQLRLDLAPGFAVSSIKSGQTPCAASGQSVTCTLGDLKVFDKLSLDIIGTPANSGIMVTRASANTTDQEVSEQNNTQSLSTKVAQAIAGDINSDGIVDRNDVNVLNNYLNQPSSGPSDPLDINADGVIDALDARKVVLLCTKPRCGS